jgi:hypothetical protein
MGASRGLDGLFKGTLPRGAIGTFYAMFSIIIVAWLCGMLYVSYICTLCLAYYRVVGIVLIVIMLSVTVASWLALANRKVGITLGTLILAAIGLKLAYWSYYVPEWNYRYSQGPWARAIAQWIPRRWSLYTMHDWPPDLAFFTKRTVRQLYSPYHLEYQPVPAYLSKFVLLLPSEYENWPADAPPLSLVAKFEDASASERILARTPGRVPLPPGRDPDRRGVPGIPGSVLPVASSHGRGESQHSRR